MKKIGKFSIFLIILFLGIGYMVYKFNLDINENIYVVSESKENNKQLASDVNLSKELDNKDIRKDYDNSIKDVNMITIHISGEVNNPGIVNIESDKRLSDAVDKLGGVTENADLNNINLAMKIEDAKHYIIPKIGEEIKNNESINNENNNSDSNKVNINNATIEDLDKLPGIGEATANKIINYREENGDFKSIEELKNVNGIGSKKYEQIKDEITLN